ncbi:glutaredoxin family protein [Candidatus Microgenomates bacterium]|nr:glutaredoxin family protein [Candidatus Microgenomates bacterium]
MPKSAVIYTTNTCAYCGPVKDFLKQKKIAFEEVNLDDQPQRRQELLAITGQMAVPVTVITKEDNSKAITVGLNLSKLAAVVGE